MWKISMYDPEYKRIRQDAEALNLGQTPKLLSLKMERLLKAVAAAIKVERAARAVVETKKKAEEEARSATEEAMNEFFTATKVTDDLIGQAAMEAEMQRSEIPAALKKHIKELAIAMGKQKVLDQAVINHAVRRDSRDSPEGKKKSCRTLRRKQAEGLKRDRELKQGFPMLLRNHPLLSHRGFHSWPPVWACTGGVKNQRPKGEVGILRKVILSRVHPTQRCYLEIDHEGSKYMGCLIIDDHAFCAQIVRLLQDSCNRPIAEIGSLDISHLL